MPLCISILCYSVWVFKNLFYTKSRCYPEPCLPPEHPLTSTSEVMKLWRSKVKRLAQANQASKSRAACSSNLSKYVHVTLIPNTRFVTIFVMLLCLSFPPLPQIIYTYSWTRNCLKTGQASLVCSLARDRKSALNTSLRKEGMRHG